MRESAVTVEEQGFSRDEAAKTLDAIADVWRPAHPDIVLPEGSLVRADGNRLPQLCLG